jgi:hypothetical protein
MILLSYWESLVGEVWWLKPMAEEASSPLSLREMAGVRGAQPIE